MSGDFGPFSVSPAQISGLNTSFTGFVRRLIAAEAAEADMGGDEFTTTLSENTPDGGVDAYTKRSVGTRWIPAGETAWQFKRSDLEPAKCREELLGATEAQAILKRGGSYRLVLGSDLSFLQIKNRQEKLIDARAALGITCEEGAIEVLHAEHLARWTEEHPSLAVSKILGGAGDVVMDFKDWSLSQRHHNVWVPAQAQLDLIEQVREHIIGVDIDLHIEGVSGLGKSRAVLEALRGQGCEPIVTYTSDYEKLPPHFLRHLTNQDRRAVVVIDECSAREHEKIAEHIQVGSPIRIITIGEPDARLIQAPVVKLEPASEEAIREVLKQNEPGLWSEARTVVASMAAGNIAWSLIVAKEVVRNPDFSISRSIDAAAIRQYITDSLPTGDDFLACSALALFSRIGWEGGLEDELEILAVATGLDGQILRRAGAYLESRGFFTTQGRYRAITPHPLALFLASSAWSSMGREILMNLVPLLTRDMLERLFDRAADLGEFEPTRAAVRELLDNDGPYASLDRIVVAGQSRLLPQAAVISPEDTMKRLGTIISDATEKDLFESLPARRTMVYALEKLAWHTRTFDEAEGALLKLARAENESYANNATGLWVSLFGAGLPATGADSVQRLAVLKREASSGDARDRRLVVQAASRALSLFESVTVSGEIQGGNLVERRGSPLTYEELWEYQRGAIEVIRVLAGDGDEEVATAAVSALAGSVHPLLENPQLMPTLTEALVTLPRTHQGEVRNEIAHLKGLFSRVVNTEARSAALEQLITMLPAQDDEEILAGLMKLHTWDLEPGELREQLRRTLLRLESEKARDLTIRGLENNEEIPASYELGAVVADLWFEDDQVVRAVVSTAENKNAPALFGFLDARQSPTDESVYQSFLDGELSRNLGDATRLAILTRGPINDDSWEKGRDLLQRLSAWEGVSRFLGWRMRLTNEHVKDLLRFWTERIESQRDYNAVVDFASSCIFNQSDRIREIEVELYELASMRKVYPSTANQTWDWSQIVSAILVTRDAEMLEIMLDLIEAGEISGLEGYEDGDVLNSAIRRLGKVAWHSIAKRIESGSRGIESVLRGRVTESIPVDDLVGWVGNSLERAQVLASVASAGKDKPTPAARFLLTEFPDDDRISSSLAAELMTGSWVGPESSRLRTQIDRLKGWMEPSESSGVREWAREITNSLERQFEAAVQREAERGW
jgi:hypothetical protein